MMNHGYLWGLMHNIMVLSMTINSPFFFMRLTPQLITKGRSIVCVSITTCTTLVTMRFRGCPRLDRSKIPLVLPSIYG